MKTFLDGPPRETSHHHTSRPKSCCFVLFLHQEDPSIYSRFNVETTSCPSCLLIYFSFDTRHPRLRARYLRYPTASDSNLDGFEPRPLIPTSKPVPATLRAANGSNSVPGAAWVGTPPLHFFILSPVDQSRVVSLVGVNRPLTTLQAARDNERQPRLQPVVGRKYGHDVLAGWLDRRGRRLGERVAMG